MNKLFTVALLSLAVFLLCSCSKEDDVNSIDVALGTYVGNLTVYPKSGPSKAFANSTVTLTKESEGKIKVTPISSSGGSPIVFDVFTEGSWVVNPEDDPKGVFLYNHEDGSLSVTLMDGIVQNSFYFKGYRKN